MRFKLFATLVACVLLTAGCGGGGSTGSTGTTGSNPAGISDSGSNGNTVAVTAPPTTSVASLAGTVATGSPLANATVTVKDAGGSTASATTGSDGSYTCNVTGMTAPFLIYASGKNHNLFSVAYSAGTANVTPVSDAAIGAFFKCQGTTSAAAFNGLFSGTAIPTRASLQLIISQLELAVQSLLTNNSVPTGFNPLSDRFLANHLGFDAVLDSIQQTGTGTLTVTNGTTTTAITITGSITNGVATIGVNWTSTNSTTGATTSNQATTVVSTTTPGSTTTSPLDAAVAGVTTTLTNLATAVNGASSSLTASVIAPFVASNFLDQGENAAQFENTVATNLSGVTITAEKVRRVVNFNPNTNTITVLFHLDTSAGAIDQLMTFLNDGGTWLFLGTQSDATTVSFIQVENANNITNTSNSGFAPEVAVSFVAPQSTVNTVAISDATGTVFNNASVPLSNVLDISVPNLVRNDFLLNAFPQAFPPVGTVFTLTATPATGSPQTFTQVEQATTTDTVGNYTVTAGGRAVTHALASIVGQRVHVAWQQPTTFIPVRQTLSAAVQTASVATVVNSSTLRPGQGPVTSQGTNYTNGYAPQGPMPIFPLPGIVGSTTGTLTIPTTITDPTNNNTAEPVTQVTISLTVQGPNGELVVVQDTYQ